MTNKPQSDMPDVIYAIVDYEIYDMSGHNVWSDEPFYKPEYSHKDHKYISEASHEAALAELEVKHREEMRLQREACADSIYDSANLTDHEKRHLSMIGKIREAILNARIEESHE